MFPRKTGKSNDTLRLLKNRKMEYFPLKFEGHNIHKLQCFKSAKPYVTWFQVIQSFEK